MQIHSFAKNAEFNPHRIVTQVLLETSFSKEIRILLQKDQVMKEHKAPFPIIVHLLQGEIDFGVEGENHKLTAGDVITLEAHVPHDLTALSNSVVRLTLSKLDKPERVEQVYQKIN